MMTALTRRSWLPALTAALWLAPHAAMAQTPPTPPDPQTTGTQQQQPPPQPPPPEPAPPAIVAPPPTTVNGVPGTSSQVPTPYNLAAPARQGRPNRSMFAVPRANRKPVLTLEGLFGGGNSGDPLATQRGGAPGGFGGSEGGSGAVTGSANLTYEGGSRRLGITGSSVFYGDYYPDYQHAKFQPRTIASVALSFPVGRSTHVVVSQGYKNLPELGFSQLQDPDFNQTVPISQDFAITADRYGRYSINGDVSHTVSRRMKANASVGWAHGYLSSGSSFETQSAIANLSYILGKGLAAYAGYVVGAQTYHSASGAESRDKQPSLRLGIDYGKALSVARRTSIAFSTGLAQITNRLTNETQYEVVGAASLKREFGRSWEAGVVYSRNVRYLEALNQPVLTDALGLVASGSFSRRLTVKGAFGASAGQLAAITGQKFDTYYGGGQINYGISRNYAVGADYAYSRLSNPPGALPTVAVGLYSQNSARVYIQFWTPLLSRPVRVE